MEKSLKIQMEEMKRQYPEQLKLTGNLRRLLELAKQAPFAGANADFLEMWETKIKEKESFLSLSKVIMSVTEEKE